TELAEYAMRWDHLVNGGGSNEPYLLNAMTVQSNGGGNTLTGQGGGAGELNLYFGNLDLADIADWDANPGEQFFTIAGAPQNVLKAQPAKPRTGNERARHFDGDGCARNGVAISSPSRGIAWRRSRRDRKDSSLRGG